MMLLEKKLEQERILSGSTSVYFCVVLFALYMRLTTIIFAYPNMGTKALDSINYNAYKNEQFE